MMMSIRKRAARAAGAAASAVSAVERPGGASPADVAGVSVERPGGASPAGLAVVSAVPARRPRVEGDREVEVLDAALRVLGEVGYDRLTMDLVAIEARASKATLYRRWQNKATLVVDAVSRAKGMPNPDSQTTGSLRGDLLASWCGHDGWSSSVPMSVMLGLMTALHRDEELNAAFREGFLGPRQAVARKVFEAARDRGEISDGVDLDLVMSLLPAVCVQQELFLNRSVDDAFVTRVIDTVVLPACSSPATSSATQLSTLAGADPIRSAEADS